MDKIEEFTRGLHDPARVSSTTRAESQRLKIHAGGGHDQV